MNYPRIMQQVYGQPWAVRESTHENIQRTLDAHIRGESKLPVYAIQNHFNAQALDLTPPRTRGSRVYRRGAMAYVPVQGIIGKHLSLFESMCGGYDIDQLAQDVDEVGNDATVKNVLFDYDSPGGQIAGVPETSKMLASLRGVKQTFGFSASQVCSAAYWLYSQQEYRYTTESAVSGAVGVYVYLQDRTEQLKAQGITPILIRAGEHKGAGMPGNPLTEKEIGMIQEQVTMLYNMMCADIKSAHSKVTDAVLQGQVFIGQQALDAKLADAKVLTLGNLVARLS